DSTYPFVKVTLDEDYPRLLIVRRRHADGARYFGPYPDAGAMRSTLHLVGRLFPLRKKRIPPFKDRPCLNYHIGRCLAPCQGLVSRADYDAMVSDVIRFLEGRQGELKVRLKAQMAAAAEDLEFERAAKLRDLLQALDRVVERQLVVGEQEDDYDAIALAPSVPDAAEPGDTCIQVFQVREGKVVNRLEFRLTGQTLEEAAEDRLSYILSAFLAQYYAEREVPPLVLVSVTPQEQPTLEAYLTDRRGSKVQLRIPQRGPRRKLLDMVQTNAAQGAACQAVARQAEERRDPRLALTALAEALGMEAYPERIEGFDISHVQGTDTVASLVVAIAGIPDKRHYRTFKIKSHDRNDDFASMHEVVKRRYSRILQAGADMPDLILIDGGKGQLHAACQALADLGIGEQPIFGLAKRLEEVYLPGRSDPVILPADSPALFVIQRLRDEAHRFAVSFHRRIRGKHMHESVLDAVQGIGKARKRQLLSRIGSVEAIRNLSVAELARRGGIPLALAQRVLASLSSDRPT
ncbi:MAG: excinuclease ABC subunit UvrC, partial [Cyanobacteria bacterium REEB65]|nr:excinuclease ABC subunit UvrC [Cyanobacteria bacterium REEB65]